MTSLVKRSSQIAEEHFTSEVIRHTKPCRNTVDFSAATAFISHFKIINSKLKDAPHFKIINSKLKDVAETHTHTKTKQQQQPCSNRRTNSNYPEIRDRRRLVFRWESFSQCTTTTLVRVKRWLGQRRTRLLTTRTSFQLISPVIRTLASAEWWTQRARSEWRDTRERADTLTKCPQHEETKRDLVKKDRLRETDPKTRTQIEGKLATLTVDRLFAVYDCKWLILITKRRNRKRQ